MATAIDWTPVANLGACASQFSYTRDYGSFYALCHHCDMASAPHRTLSAAMTAATQHVCRPQPTKGME